METKTASSTDEAPERVAKIEWRRGKGHDVLIYIEEYGEVMKAWDADADLLRDFLNRMDSWSEPVKVLQTEIDQRDPETWGDLAMSRAADGQVLDLDPEEYWDGIYWWFRRNKTDPHPWKGRSS